MTLLYLDSASLLLKKAKGVRQLAARTSHQARAARERARATLASAGAGLWCPGCRRPLAFIQTVSIEVQGVHRYDWFSCACGVQSYECGRGEWSWQDR